MSDQERNRKVGKKERKNRIKRGRRGSESELKEDH